MIPPLYLPPVPFPLCWLLVAPRTELVGSVLFALSLNFKQMALYYAPAFFFYLLASCIWGPAGGNTVGENSAPRVCFFFNKIK